MTRKQQLVLDFIKSNPGKTVTPGLIASSLGYSKRSGWMPRMLKNLVGMGSIEQVSRGKYRAVVSTTVETDTAVSF